MDTYNTLSKLYQRWLQRNKLNPLISADDLLYDHHCGNITLSNIQETWVRKFINVWSKAEDREFEKSKTDQDKIGELWNEYLYRDKRSFNEYFSEEFGFTCNEDITYKQMRLLCVMFFHNKNVKNNLWRK
tara:strand:- start:50 stop:439 length:390 start_codon:yes stop_codon:yes gene_type:complete